MSKYCEFDNSNLDYVAFTNDKVETSTCKSADEYIYSTDRGYNYFGIRSNISYSNKEDLSFWEY
ncbi:MAG: hypothetical protein ACRDA3_06515 [Peptostreptococcaceae bacterium]